MKIVLVGCYSLAALLSLLSGWLYPEIAAWSYLAAIVLAVHFFLSMVASGQGIPPAGKTVAVCWHSFSSLITIGLLFPYMLRHQRVWLIFAVAVMGLTLVLTIVIAHAMKSAPTAGRAVS